MEEKLTLKTIADPKSRYGSAKLATRSLITQRITGALNAVFTLFFVWLVVRLAGAGRAEMLPIIANPIVAIVTGLMVISVAMHMRIGMQEVIEDYVHDEKLNALSLMLNTVFAVLIAGVALASLLKLVFWG